MFDIKAAARDLESLLHDIVVKQGIFVPISKDLIRYKNYTLVKNQDGDWVVLIIKNGKKYHIATVLLKMSAFAICKLHEKGRHSRVTEVDSYDKIFKKNYIDSLFYKKTVESNRDSVSKDNAQWRYEIAISEAKLAKQKIDAIFYASIA